jgi:GDPmannose 4,6-dehydratase
MNKTAIIVGDRGQDGTLLRASLEKQGIHVVGVGRDRLSMPLSLGGKSGGFSIENTEQVSKLVAQVCPTEIYYLAAHHVSSEQHGADNCPYEYDAYHRTHVVGLLNFLWAICKHSLQSRFFYAASSLVFDGSNGPTQNEETPFTPVGFYGLTKTQGLLICREFREKYGVLASGGILYNHESALRPEYFLSKKIISSAHRISLGVQQNLIVGNLSAEIDWGYAPDYIEAFQLILSTSMPTDFVVATGESHSVAEFVKIAFNCFELDSEKFVLENPNILNRHVPRKIGDCKKLKISTGWMPTLTFPDMVRALVNDYLEGITSNYIANITKEALYIPHKSES